MDTPFAIQCRQYAQDHRDVFLDEIRRFIRGANNTREELRAIRVAAKARRHLIVGSGKRGKRGRPRGAKRPSSAIMKTEQIQEPESVLYDPHQGFRNSCMVCGDIPNLREVFLREILLFIASANKSELAALGKAVAKRAKSPGIKKKRGRPPVLDDEESMYAARIVAWSRRIERKPWRQIARIVSERLPGRFAFPDENSKSVGWTLQRVENYLAAAIWRAIPPSYVRESAAGRELSPTALDHKRLQAFIEYRTGLPFRTHPVECTAIVNALWPRGLAADWNLSDRHLAYTRKKRSS